MTAPHLAWTVANAAVVAAEELEKLGFGRPHLRLLRHGENITFDALGTSVVARLARPYADPVAVATEVKCARFLEKNSFLAGRLIGEIDQPIQTRLGLMTLWDRMRGRVGNDDDYGALGHVLNKLHKLEQPNWLRPWDPLRKVPERLEEVRRQNAFPRRDITFLERLRSELQKNVDLVRHGHRLEPEVICHGDVHPGNTIVTDNGDAVLVDWEDCSSGPWEWDLSEVLMSVKRFGLGQSQYSAFSKSYGRDIKVSPQADLMLRLRELTATSWLLQNSGSSKEVLNEGQLRVSTMRDPNDQRTWSAF